MRKILEQKKISANSISLAGEFAVLSQLALRGYDANMTLGRTKNVDILVSDPDTGGMFKLEVKSNLRDVREEPTVSKLFGKTISNWIMHVKHEKISQPNLFYCFVAIGRQGNTFRFFIVPSSIVAEYTRQEHAYWLRNTKKGKETDMRIFRIGLRNEKYALPTPLADVYENNWDFKTYS